jgi:thymidylate synthase (FAD)
MRIIDPYVEVQKFNPGELMKRIEKAGRTCYKSEGAITEDTHIGFIRKIIQSGHESVLEHEKITARIICDRGVSHEIVRHRLAAYSQESTRYCNYSGEKFGNEITVIKPFFFERESQEEALWYIACTQAEKSYLRLLYINRSPQEARSVLPNSLKTEIVVTYNLREWRHFFRLRAAKAAHPQMRQIAIPLLLFMQQQMPPVFGDVKFDTEFDPADYAEVRWEE